MTARRRTRVVRVGRLGIGGDEPIRIQSMTTTTGRDVEASVEQAAALAGVGCEIVRITAPHLEDARALGEVRRRLDARGLGVPLVADVHFLPEAAMEAALRVEKVRINPGNFADRGRFRPEGDGEAAQTAALGRIEEAFAPLAARCRDRGVAVRIGVNHGSLSDRILQRHGDTPEGMVECAMEYLRVSERLGLRDVVLSMKASSARVCVRAVRLLVARMEAEGLDHPLHLGVTEAGEGEDGRVRSAVGIGALLAEGIGDTIRVSLAEDPVAEIPVARALVEAFARTTGDGPGGAAPAGAAPDPAAPFERRRARRVQVGDSALGGSEPPRVALRLGPDAEADLRAVRAAAAAAERPEILLSAGDGTPVLVGVVVVEVGTRAPSPAEVRAAAAAAGDAPVLLRFRSDSDDRERVRIEAAGALGGPLLDGIGDAVLVDAPRLDAPFRTSLPFRILQAAGARSTRVELIACPSCGRTLFDLPAEVARVRALVGHLVGVKVAVMGCVVNGPGEMADADFGYVGGAAGKVNLFAGRACVERGVPIGDAPLRLVELIRRRGRWADPP